MKAPHRVQPGWVAQFILAPTMMVVKWRNIIGVDKFFLLNRESLRISGGSECDPAVNTSVGLLIVFSEVCRSLCRRMPQENCPKL